MLKHMQNMKILVLYTLGFVPIFETVRFLWAVSPQASIICENLKKKIFVMDNKQIIINITIS